jgi:hypothetical protein
MGLIQCKCGYIYPYGCSKEFFDRHEKECGKLTPLEIYEKEGRNYEVI